MNRLFGSSSSSQDSSKEPAPETELALPASWYRSPAMYELERRAIFSKRWIVVSHRLRFMKPGDYVRICEAGFDFFLIKDRQENIRGFHNACRHRAYPVVQEKSGTASILACNYHGEDCMFYSRLDRLTSQGWSYGLNGKLAKAPQFQEVKNFDKDGKSLYRIHVHIDHLGFVWINLDAAEKPSIAWEDDFDKVDLQPRLQKFDMTQYRFDHQWEMIGDYNWKTLADNYNEV